MWLDVVIACVEIAVMLHGQTQSTGGLEYAEARSLACPRRQRHVKDLDEDAADIVTYPLIEDTDEEVAILRTRHRVVRHFETFLVPRLIVAPDDWDELDKLAPASSRKNR